MNHNIDLINDKCTICKLSVDTIHYERIRDCPGVDSQHNFNQNVSNCQKCGLALNDYRSGANVICPGKKPADPNGHQWVNDVCSGCGITKLNYLQSDAGPDCPKTKNKLLERVENDFSPRGCSVTQIDTIVMIEKASKDFAINLAKMCPEGRELSLALTKLEEAVHWAVCSVAKKGYKWMEVVGGGNKAG